MSDDKSKQGYQDDVQIADDEIHFWARKWGVTAQEIRDAKKATNSTFAKTVREHLVKNNKIVCDEEE